MSRLNFSPSWISAPAKGATKTVFSIQIHSLISCYKSFYIETEWRHAIGFPSNWLCSVCCPYPKLVNESYKTINYIQQTAYQDDKNSKCLLDSCFDTVWSGCSKWTMIEWCGLFIYSESCQIGGDAEHSQVSESYSKSIRYWSEEKIQETRHWIWINCTHKIARKMSVSDISPDTDLETVLTEVGAFGLYQVIIYFMICIPSTLSATYQVNYMFSANTLEYR